MNFVWSGHRLLLHSLILFFLLNGCWAGNAVYLRLASSVICLFAVLSLMLFCVSFELSWSDDGFNLALTSLLAKFGLAL